MSVVVEKDARAASGNGKGAGTPHRPPSRRWFLVAIAIGAIIALAVAVAALRPNASSGVAASGTIEAIESDVSPKVQGRLLELRVRDGDAVKKGETLAVLERTDPELSADQARANVAAAKAQINVAQAAYDLQKATYQTTVTQASSDVGVAGSRSGEAEEALGIERHSAELDVDRTSAQATAARAAFDRSATELQRAKSLVATGDEPQRTLDDARNSYAAAAAELKAARDALALARANVRNVQIREFDLRASQLQQVESVAALASAHAQAELVQQRHAQLQGARAQLAQAQAALRLAQDQVRETTLVAPFDGYAISHNFEVGDLIAAGAAVLTVGDLAHPYLYVYVGETDLPRIKTGTRAEATIDGLPGRSFSGSVTEISNTAEFTPENVQTKEERIEYLVFRVKIQFTDTTGLLKPGLPADAVIDVDRSVGR